MPAAVTTASWSRAETTAVTVPPTVVPLVTILAPGAARTAATAWLANWACSSRCCVPASTIPRPTTAAAGLEHPPAHRGRGHDRGGDPEPCRGLPEPADLFGAGWALAQVLFELG